MHPYCFKPYKHCKTSILKLCKYFLKLFFYKFIERNNSRAIKTKGKKRIKLSAVKQKRCFAGLAKHPEIYYQHFYSRL